MLVKFIPTKKAGTSIDVVLAYIFQHTDTSGKPRSTVKQVAGTIPELLKFTCDEVPSKNPYSHSVLSFSDSEMETTTEAQRLAILNLYVDELAAGLGDKRRMPYLCVDHGNHFHVLALRYDLRSGKVYQPFVKARGDTQRFNCWKSLMCLKYGLVEPCESGSLFRLSAKFGGESVKRLLGVLNKVGREIVEGAPEIDGESVVQELLPVIEVEGFEVVRMTRSGFSVMGPEMKRNVRFRYTRKMMGYGDEKGVEADVVELKERLACYREKLMVSMGRYHESGIPLAIDITQLYGCHCMSGKGGKWDLTFS